jgi:tripartite-type tricarboxylate transporter receptor subunit TctC
MKRHATLTTLVAATLLGSATVSAAADVADFYRGKRINLVIGYGTGGGYDIYARLLARFIGEHIPGNPAVVPQNMPGAGSRRAANWLYAVAPKDGTVVACLGQATPTDQALGQRGIQFDARKFNWIGNLVAVNNITFVSAASGVATIDDAKKKTLSDATIRFKPVSLAEPRPRQDWRDRGRIGPCREFRRSRLTAWLTAQSR